MDHKLATFCAVAQRKSFSKAALDLHLTQPAVSLQVQNIEEMYGVRLFDRYRNKVQLTSAGEIFYKYATQIVRLYHEAASEVASYAGSVQGRLRVGAATTIGEYVLPRVVGAFKQNHPAVEIFFQVGNNQSIIKGVLENELDMGLIAGTCNDKRIEVQKYLEDELFMVASPEHPLAKKMVIGLQELRSANFILREAGSGTRVIVEETLESIGIKVSELSILGEYSSLESIKGSVEAGPGVSIISQWCILKELELGVLNIVHIENLRFRRYFNFIYHKGEHRSHLAREFADFCKQYSTILESIMTVNGNIKETT